ncbi:hypothetical protein KJE01_16280 [Escherichia marmotae]|uniref:Uncharacterized protein n=1 Tax=Escherichia marmotae TaxID=1499973 RepID=A0AAW5MU85_9ESCH|nr:hypothetical protein [Escherichia marmotae]MBY7302199.1 hypothetical protein [Escherichia marmotae]MBY7380350.1 hypothetical protein [Escherichia marmotae]MBY7388808.1 hypothetical protein [Escherichia marmotae]MBY7412711.1 hypothetical protein [Escherichia marmotae]MBY7470414.1 hypothetical protein [Escherichia marmotae]
MIYRELDKALAIL